MTDLDFDAIEGMLMPCSCIDRPAEHYPTCPTGARAALVAALRDARNEVERLRESLALAESVFMAEARASRQYEAERDDWRRRYEALRDGVTGLHAERQGMAGCRECGYDWPCPTAALVARAEGGES